MSCEWDLEWKGAGNRLESLGPRREASSRNPEQRAQGQTGTPMRQVAQVTILTSLTLNTCVRLQAPADPAFFNSAPLFIPLPFLWVRQWLPSRGPPSPSLRAQCQQAPLPTKGQPVGKGVCLLGLLRASAWAHARHLQRPWDQLRSWHKTQIL